MADHVRCSFSIGPTDYGKWLAISNHTPNFVFEGNSAEEVEAIANRALDFYFGISGQITTNPVVRQGQTLSSFSRKKTVERRA